MKEKIKEFLKKLKFIPLVSLGGVLWKTGGMGHKFLRRFVLPAVLAGLYFWHYRDWQGTIATYGFAMTFTLGYGIPDFTWLVTGVGDEGSSISRFWIKIFKTASLREIRFLTRLTVGTAYSLICIPAILQGDKSAWDMVALAVGVPLIVDFEPGEIEEALIGGWVVYWFGHGWLF